METMTKQHTFLFALFLLLAGVPVFAQDVPTSEATPQTWRFTTAAPASGWQQPGFRDAGWQAAPASFGHGIGGVRTEWTADDIWLRRTFTLTKLFAHPYLNVLHDDDAEVYIDGELAATVPGATSSYDMTPLSVGAKGLLLPGRHTLAVHCHNVAGPQIIDVGLSDFGPLTAARPIPVRDIYSDTWVATDGLGRAVSTATTIGPPRANKTVAVFYFLANHVRNVPVYDNTQLLAANPLDPQYGPINSPHWWSEPWLGYYQSDDPSVIRTHMAMLADAGVDVLIFDNTNGPTYPDVYLNICRVLEQMKSEGVKAPQIAFITGHGAENTLLTNFYSQNLFPDLWFRWKGKPLMLYAPPDNGKTLSAAVRGFFTLRESWAWTPSDWFGNGHDAWPWLDNYPQNYGWHEDPKKPEAMAVEVAQHATTSIGRSSLMQKEPPVNELRVTPDTEKGLCFAQQFDYALKVDPELIFVTGWNEWTAGHYTDDSPTFAGKPHAKGGAIFVDEYNEEFSRDIEPEQGRLQDDYYYQFVDYVRRYKGVRPVPPLQARTITTLAQWRTVTPEFRDAVGDPVHRDHPGWGNAHYRNQTGRNDIVAAKVSFDTKNVYFYARTAAKMTPHTDPNWMLLYINTDADAKTGWLGYDFVVNRHVKAKITSLEKNIGGNYAWQSAGSVRCSQHGTEMMVTIPRALLGIKAGAATLDFKWADNCYARGDASDFTLNGDAAPDGRFSFRANLR